MDDPHMVPAPTSLDFADQIAALLESTALLQRTAAQLLSQISPQSVGAPGAFRGSYVDLQAPQSAQASVLGPGVPIPSRGWQKNHSAKDKIVARTKVRLMKDGWEDCDDTDEHATRLSEAMLRLGMEDMDNFATEASRLNCSNMAISATLVSAVVATFVANTYNQHDSRHMRIVNGLWLLSLFLSLSTATLCMLVSEWLTWSTSQELRDLSFLYRLIRTALRSLLMHLSIFLFFAGLMVLMWNESTVDVCIVPTIACAIFFVYYVIATVRAPYLSFFRDVRQFDDHDFRGLRVQIWTPFTLGTHHTLNYFFTIFVDPLKRFVRLLSMDLAKKSDNPTRPPMHTNTSELTSMQKITAASPTDPPSIPYQSLEHLASPIITDSPRSLRVQLPALGLRTRGRSPLSARTDEGHNIESPRVTSRAGTPISIAPSQNEADVDVEDLEFRRKLRATRTRRLTDHEFMRPAGRVRGTVDV